MNKPILCILVAFAILAGSVRAQVAGDMIVERDVAYGLDSAQRLDVYRPKAAKNAPVLLLVHGGAWRIGDKAHSGFIDDKVAYWLPKGFVIISVNYRMLPKAEPTLQADDVAGALAFAQVKARGWGGDPTRFVLMGHSAGAHLAMLLAADADSALRRGAKPWLGTIALDSAALDVVSIMQSRHLPLYDRAFGDDPAGWRAASPLHRLTGRPKPVLLVCSTRRRDPCLQAQQFAEKAKAKGARVDVLAVDLSHRDINVTLGRDNALTDAVDGFLRTLVPAR